MVRTYVLFIHLIRCFCFPPVVFSFSLKELNRRVEKRRHFCFLVCDLLIYFSSLEFPFLIFISVAVRQRRQWRSRTRQLSVRGGKRRTGIEYHNKIDGGRDSMGERGRERVREREGECTVCIPQLVKF